MLRTCEAPCERNFFKNDEIWKELVQTKGMGPTTFIFEHPFSSWSSLKITSKKMM